MEWDVEVAIRALQSEVKSLKRQIAELTKRQKLCEMAIYDYKTNPAYRHDDERARHEDVGVNGDRTDL